MKEKKKKENWPINSKKCSAHNWMKTSHKNNKIRPIKRKMANTAIPHPKVLVYTVTLKKLWI